MAYIERLATSNRSVRRVGFQSKSGRNSGSRGGLPHFEEHTLREFAGDKTFARGVGYHANGQVEIGVVKDGRIFGRVMGQKARRNFTRLLPFKAKI